jgi:TolB protein
MTMRIWLLVLVSSIVAMAGVDTVYMEISASGARLIPVGVIPFEKSEGNWSMLDEEPSQILSRDFLLSGRLDAINQNSYSRLAFFKARAAYYLSGKLNRTSDGKVEVVCKLNATQSQEMVIGETYRIAPNQVRQAIHDFADKVIYQITGSVGVASTRIAYVAKIEGNKQIKVSDYDGYNPVQVTSHASINFMPAWGQDPDKLYFVSFRNGTSQIFERTMSNGDVRLLFPNLGQTFSPAGSPVSNEILFTVASNGGSDLYRGIPATGKYERMTFQRAAETSPAFSPNGKEILYSADRGGSPQIYVMDRDGSDSRRITFMGRYNESPSWSPQGDRIAYASMDNGLFNIYTCDLDGSDVLQLTSNAGNNEHPSWSPDGTLIAFSSTRSGSSQIYVMRKDGTGVTRITSGGENSWQTWAPKLNKEKPNE